MSYYSYATKTETEQYLFFEARSDLYCCHVDGLKALHVQPTSRCILKCYDHQYGR